MFCPNCGNQIKDDVKFCPKCGAKVNGETKREASGPSGAQPAGNIRSGSQPGTPSKNIQPAMQPKNSRPAAPPTGKPPKKRGKLIGILIALLILVLAGSGTAYYVNQRKTAAQQEKEAANKKKEEVEKKKEEEREKETGQELLSGSSKPASTTAAAVTEAPTAALEAAAPVTVSLLYSNQADFSGLSKVIVQKENVTQSSFVVQKDSTIDNTGWRAFDGKTETSWQEGQPDDGLGEYVRAGFDREYQVKDITFKLGNHRSDVWFIKNNRPKKLIILLGSERYEVGFPDEMAEFTVVFSEPVASSDIKVIVDEVYPGTEYRDTVIAEIGVYGN